MKKGEYAIESGTLFHQIHTYLSLDLTDWQLRAYKKFYAPDFQLKSGTFLIPEDMPLSQALEKPLVTPVHTDITFMILPGWSVYDIDSYLSQKKFIQPGDLIDAHFAIPYILLRAISFFQMLKTISIGPALFGVTETRRTPP